MALFDMGTEVAKPAAIKFCAQHNVNPLALLGRHIGGDWGDLDKQDSAANIHAVQNELRVFSSYEVREKRVWVITEADRSSTWLLLPNEY